MVGNHELASLRGYHARGGGSRPDAEPKYAWTDELSPTDIDYLQSLPYTISLPLHRAIVVHAGLVPNVPLEDQKRVDMVSMRNLVAVDLSLRREQVLALAMAQNQRLGVESPARVLPLGALHLIFNFVTAADCEKHLRPAEWQAREKNSEGVAWAPHWPGPTHVYFGHDAQRLLQRCAHATGLDTGCLYGRKLTAAILELGRPTRIVSVPARRIYVSPPSAPSESILSRITRGFLGVRDGRGVHLFELPTFPVAVAITVAMLVTATLLRRSRR